MSRLRAGEPRGPAGEAGSAAPPLSGARLAGPRGAEFPEERRRRRRPWRRRWEPGRGMGGRSRGPRGRRASRAQALRSPRCRRSCAPCRSHTSMLHAGHFLISFSWFLSVVRSGFPPARGAAALAPPARGGWGASPSRGEKGGRVPGVDRSRRRGLLADRGSARPRSLATRALGPSRRDLLRLAPWSPSSAPPSPVSETKDLTEPRFPPMRIRHVLISTRIQAICSGGKVL